MYYRTPPRRRVKPRKHHKASNANKLVKRIGSLAALIGYLVLGAIVGMIVLLVIIGFFKFA